MAGEFTEPALNQLKNNGFTVIYIPYADVIKAFKRADFNIAFNETTPHEVYTNASQRLAKLTEREKEDLCKALTALCKGETEKFMEKLRATLERVITRVSLLPLFGEKYDCTDIQEAIDKLDEIDLITPTGKLERIEIIVDYNNGDSIRGSFQSKVSAIEFLKKVEQ